MYTLSISNFCASQERRSLVESNHQIQQSKDIVDLLKVDFCINKLFSQCNTGSCSVHITGGVNIY